MADNREKGASKLCVDVELTPVQCNEVLEDKLAHLEPLLKCALETFRRVEEVLANGGINWRKIYERAASAHVGENSATKK